MLHLDNDYLQGAHPQILEALVASNSEDLAGYGMDAYTQAVQDRMRELCQCSEAQVRLVTGGTQANMLVIDTLLNDTEGVISADTGHVAVHESGAIEYSGHKVLTVPSDKGKLNVRDVRCFIEDFYADETHPHMVYPGMVYISQPTEYGTLYSKSEIEGLASLCQEYDLPLFVDGARLVYALASPENDLSLADLAHFADVFYLGGTKAGLLCGEALVFTKNNLPKHFSGLIKQRGALLAKGRLLAVQFKALMDDNLYLKIGQETQAKTDRLKAILHHYQIPFYLESPTNQQFIILEKEVYQALKEDLVTSYFGKLNDHQVIVRLATSWSTTDQALDQLEVILDKYFA